MLIQRFPLISALFLAWPGLASPAEDAPDAKVKSLLEKVSSDSADARYAARAEAPEVGAAAVVPLAKLLYQSASGGQQEYAGATAGEPQQPGGDSDVIDAEYKAQ